MANQERTLWGIHAGKTGDADTLFVKGNRIALGWPELGDLSKLPDDRGAFKAKTKAGYPDFKPQGVITAAGQLFRFMHELAPGDYVAYPSKRDRLIHIGRVDGAYQYNPKDEPAYPNQRGVEWLVKRPRTDFTQGALYEIGAGMSFFQIKNYADEFFAALEGKLRPAPVQEDDSVAAVAQDIEDTSYDFVVKRLAQETKGHPFAAFVAHLLGTMGYKSRVSPPGSDGGVDILAHKDELGFEPPIIKVQCKSSGATVGDPEVSALYGKVGSGEFGLFVTLGTFSPKAVAFAKSRSNLRLIDREEFVALVFEHYERFDSRHKGLLPLRRVYIPEPTLEGDE